MNSIGKGFMEEYLNKIRRVLGNRRKNFRTILDTTV